MHIPLRDVALVLITGASLAPTAEGKACQCKRVGHAGISERHKEDKGTDDMRWVVDCNFWVKWKLELVQIVG